MNVPDLLAGLSPCRAGMASRTLAPVQQHVWNRPARRVQPTSASTSSQPLQFRRLPPSRQCAPPRSALPSLQQASQGILQHAALLNGDVLMLTGQAVFKVVPRFNTITFQPSSLTELKQHIRSRLQRALFVAGIVCRARNARCFQAASAWCKTPIIVCLVSKCCECRSSSCAS